MKLLLLVIMTVQMSIIDCYTYNETCANGLFCEIKVTLEVKCERFEDFCFPCELKNCPQETVYNVNCPSATCKKNPPLPPTAGTNIGKVIGWSFGAIVLLLGFFYGLKKVKKTIRRRDYSDIPMSIINPNIEPDLQEELRRHPNIVRFSTLRSNDEFETSEV